MDKPQKKKVLLTATVPSMIGQFNMENLRILKEMGYEVHVACNFQNRTVWSTGKVVQLQQTMYQNGIACKQVEFSRSPIHISQHIKAYQSLYTFMKKEQYAFVHCHTPIAAAITRLAAARTRTKVLYTAHGFHFYRHAPVVNWVMYYPFEWLLSHKTDCLITINREDFRMARKYLYARETEFIPGVGIDTEKYQRLCRYVNEKETLREEKRKEFGLTKDNIVLLSVGELSRRKNHRMVLKALSRIHGAQIRYVICGKGEQEEGLKHEVSALGLTGKVIFAGYRSDVEAFYQMADLFIFPSIQEGLPVALMEAMASGIPCLASDIRGNRDLLHHMEEYCLFPLEEDDIFLKKMEALIANPLLQERVREKNQQEIKKFDKKRINRQMRRIYEQMGAEAGKEG